MPSTLTHYVFNKELIKDKKYEKIFLLGGQGADVFFFYGYNIGKRNNTKQIRKFGTDIHSVDPNKIYSLMLKYAFNKVGEEKEILINFIRGFMYHYALDRNIHPYVFYNTGFPYTNKKYNINHGNFESILDTLMMNKYGYKDSTRSVLKAPKNQVKLCSKMFKEVAEEVFGYNYVNEDDYYKAYKDFRFVRLCIDSKYGVKKSIFNLFLKDSPINVASQPKKVKDNQKYDYLNAKNREWVMPSTGERVNYSIEDLFYKANEDCRIIDTIIYNYKNNIVSERKISKFTNNINHEGRNINDFMTFFKIIWNN